MNRGVITKQNKGEGMYIRTTATIVAGNCSCVFCLYLESGSLAAELVLQLCNLGAGGFSEFCQAGLQSLDVLHQLGGLPFFGPELRLQT